MIWMVLFYGRMFVQHTSLLEEKVIKKKSVLIKIVKKDEKYEYILLI